MASTLLELPAVERFGRFEVLFTIASGGMGEISLAREWVAAGPRLVALKRLLSKHCDVPRFVRMFRDEARLLAHIQHRCISRLYESGEVDGRPYMSIEWIHGVSLGRLGVAAGSRGLPVPVVTRILSEVACALEYSHDLMDESGRSLGVIHRDITPSNIMVGFDGSVKLIDFGVAKAETQELSTESGYVKGKLRYLAPEQLEEGRKADWRVDVFALGLNGYQGLVGRPLFDEPAPLDAVSAIRRYQSPPDIRKLRSDVPEALEAILHRALERNPARRFQTVAAMQRALEDVLAALDQPFDARAMSDYARSLFPEEAARHPLKS